MCILQPIAEHFEVFQEALGQAGLWEGHAPLAWAEWVTKENRDLPVEPQNRQQLREWLNGQDLRDPCNEQLENCLLAVCAWGGMKRHHGALTWNARNLAAKENGLEDNLMQVLGNLHELNRRQAYARFNTLRHHSRLPGMGTAYFTKIIHFLGPADGYILDQWTAKSVNLLFGPIIKMRGNWVSDENSVAHYERYCRCVELLANVLGDNHFALLNIPFEDRPALVEQALFAQSAWREHVRAKYQPNNQVNLFCIEDWEG